MTDLPSGWAWATLEDILAVDKRPITDGPFGSKLATRHYTTSGARVIRLQNIGDGVFRDEKAFISREYFEELCDHEVQPGDLLLASLGEELPRVCIAPDLGTSAIVKADCIRARIHPQMDTRWVLYALMAPSTRDWAASRIKGVGRPRLGMSGIRQIPIPVPPLVEQRRIVATIEDHLSRLGAANLGIGRVARRLRLLTKRVLVEAVPVPGPDHWRLVTVAEAGRVELGRARHPDWHVGPHMRPYLRVANVFEDRIDASDLMEMNFPPDIFERYRLAEKDILLNEGQSPEYLGRPAMYRGIPEGVAFTNSLLRFRSRSGILPEWALLVFRRHMHAGRFLREVRITTNIAHLSATRLKNVEFPVPPLEEQERIVVEVNERLDSIQRFANAVEVGSKRAQGLRKSLLAEAFAGRLVEQDPADEPASVLLERIRADWAVRRPVRRARRSKGDKTPQKETLL
ncbi:restriction endonuclease subunit S [Actinoallomurus sp. NPDC052274]|uniref:restriction endonuclease subunit S n=1 Tax=Actinoallomurus sp. NPDC052274 TaxID=3155420 RepID=UPI0034378187